MFMSSFTIRSAGPDDAPALSALAHLVSPYFTIHPDGHGAELFFETITPAAMLERLTSSQFQYWLAEDEMHGIIGAIALRDHSHLYHLFVAPDQHQRGCAKQLWQHLKSVALAAGTTGALTVNSSMYAQTVYTRFGFVTCGERQEMNGLVFIPMKFQIDSAHT